MCVIVFSFVVRVGLVLQLWRTADFARNFLGMQSGRGDSF